MRRIGIAPAKIPAREETSLVHADRSGGKLAVSADFNKANLQLAAIGCRTS
jgi:hypothetical protein